MATLIEVKPQEDFIVQMNGDYNVPFKSVEVTVSTAVAAGTILEDAATVADATSVAVLGILAQDKAAGTHYCRVMVRGNPTTVNAKAMGNYDAAHKTLLAAKDIIVVND